MKYWVVKWALLFTGWLSGWLARGSSNVIAIWFQGRRSACWLMRVRWRWTCGPPTHQCSLYYISLVLVFAVASKPAHTGRCWSHWKMIRQSHRAVLGCTGLHIVLELGVTTSVFLSDNMKPKWALSTTMCVRVNGYLVLYQDIQQVDMCPKCIFQISADKIRKHKILL